MSARRLRHDRAFALPFTALLLAVVMLSIAFAIDLGRLGLARRDMQSLADVVALDMSRHANGRTHDEILLDPDWDATFARVTAANGLDDDEVVVILGTYDVDALVFTPTAGTQVPNAARATTTRSIDYFFQPGGQSTTRSAVSYQKDISNTSLGSKYSVAQPCVFAEADSPDPCLIGPTGEAELDAALSALFGVDVDLGALTYQGLATSSITAGELAVAGGFGSVDELAEAELTVGEYAELSAQAMNNRGDVARASYFSELAAAADAREDEFFVSSPANPGAPDEIPVEFGDIATVNVPGSNSGANAVINLFDLFTAALELSNAQNALTTCIGATTPSELEAEGGVVDPVDLGALAFVGDELCTEVVSARKIAIGGVGDPQTRPPEYKTAQFVVNHTSVLRFGGGDFGLPGLNLPPAPDPSDEVPELSFLPGVPTLPAVGVPIPIGGDVDLPLELRIAGAQATLTAIECSEAENTHTVDAIIDTLPIEVQVGNGPTTPVGSITIAEGIPGVEFGIDIYIDKTISPTLTASTFVDDLPVGATQDVPGNDPFIGLTLSGSDIRIEYTTPAAVPTTVPTTLPTPPETSTTIEPPDTTVPAPPDSSAARTRRQTTSSTTSSTTTTTSTTSTTTTTTSTTSTTTTLPPTTTPSTTTPDTTTPPTTTPPTTTPSTTTPSTTTPSTTSVPTTLPPTTTSTTVPLPPTNDPTLQALADYFATVFNIIIQEQVAPQLEPVLDQMNITITSADFSNNGVGFPRYDANGDYVDLDVTCATPTLVE